MEKSFKQGCLYIYLVVVFVCLNVFDEKERRGWVEVDSSVCVREREIVVQHC